MLQRRDLLGGAGALLASTALAVPALARTRPAARTTGADVEPSTPASSPIGPLDTVAKQVLLVDATTGAVLLDKAAEERMRPSSMSKLMTVYVAFDLMKQGRLRRDQTLPVSENAWRKGGSKMFVELGSQVAVEDLLRGIVVQSGNDACIVLAEGISGTEEQFAVLLNEYARRLGMTNSTFRNATGWPDPEHLTTCHDLAILARRLISDFPDYYGLFAIPSFQWNGISQQNRDPLLGRVSGADGMKTGHTDAAGYGLVGTAKRGDRRLILVANGMTSMKMRGDECARLLEWGFANFTNVSLFRAAETLEEAPVWLGQQPSLPLVAEREVVLTLPHSWRRNLEVKLHYAAPLPAPIAKGQAVGRIEIGGEGVPPMTVPLLAGADVERLGLMSRLPAVLGHWVSG
ncbi:D-alanyl-D-alanine carboxypeptidase family protein [Teichococcus oryzae]|uniref:serine-type D-Ala-D-Ala carboxypeptidase n=1 Tax=Teichococcus oryzae TaxID=1608942 RepID=A0A5B2TEC4_9PROT|nr:D-alanyl-D-alanine carboxypeptidase family protein [Pseudoroseomonas oryzae]KAA2212509.1 D-alanyl-D-alanine carboxypeptidase [Pseudoroseomonas oryzae]